MFDDIRNSFPPITGDLNKEDHTFFLNLPAEYRGFLEVHNGGFVDDFRYTFLTGVPFKTDEVDNSSRNDCPVEFYGIPTTDALGEFPEDLLQKLVDHASENFLPHNVIAIARCVQSSLVCISLRPDDVGAIYYWDWYWRYPWCKPFFDDRINEVLQNYSDSDAILENAQHPLHQQLHDHLNFATLVRLAPNFNAWLEMCHDRREHDEP